MMSMFSLEMYFARCFELRRRVAQAGARLTTAAAAARTKAVAAKARPVAKVDSYDDPRDGQLTCVEDLPFIHFLHFVGQTLVKERDDAKLKAMKGGTNKGRARPAFARSDVW
jgi:hypothetical protein